MAVDFESLPPVLLEDVIEEVRARGMRDYFMPARGFKMADNGAQELEVFDTFEHKSGYAYMPIKSQ